MYIDLYGAAVLESPIMVTICYNGSHGTTVNHCKRICESGFKLGGGRCGRGVYFWAESPLFLELARAWYLYSLDRGNYGDDKSGCAVIIAEMKMEHTEYLDLEEIEAKNQILQMGLDQNIDLEDYGQIRKLHNVYVRRIEKKFNTTIKDVCYQASAAWSV